MFRAFRKNLVGLILITQNCYKSMNVFVTKTMRVMQLTAIILLGCCLHVAAAGHAQRVTFKSDAASLRTVLSEVSRQTGYEIIYDDHVGELNTSAFNVTEMALTEFLHNILTTLKLEFLMRGETVFIRRAIPEKSKVEIDIPPITVRGRIVNENGEAVVASVIVKGTNRGVTSNVDGSFEINDVDENAVLVVSAANIEVTEININSKANIGSVAVRMRIDSMNEVVVNKGYYRVTQRENTGNVGIVGSKEIARQPVIDPIFALQGRVAGLTITANSGDPGAAPNSIRLRGRNSIANGTTPLFIVDGVPVSNSSLNSLNFVAAGYFISPFNTINPQDIEKIEVLKDADATAIYGSRGSNGVILITTKKGKSGQTKVDGNIYYGQGSASRRLKLMNTQQYLQMRREAFKNDGIDPDDVNAPDLVKWDTTRFTDWGKTLIGNISKMSNAQLSVSGGNANTQFVLSGNYSRQTFVYANDFYDQRYSFHSNIMHISSDNKLKIDFTANYSSGINKMFDGSITSNQALPPDAPKIYNNDGSINWENSTWSNPLATLLARGTSTADNLVANLGITYEIVKNLKLQVPIGYNNTRLNVYIKRPLTAYDPVFADASWRSATNGITEVKTTIAEPQLNYSTHFGDHSLSVLSGTTFQKTNSGTTTIAGVNFSSDLLLNDIALASTTVVQNQVLLPYRLNKFYGRIGYKYKETFLLNLTGSREGSSRFGAGRQFGNFGSVGGAWIFTNENFFKTQFGWLNFGKLRASYGTTGNDQIPDYGYLSTYFGIANSAYLNIIPLRPNSLANSEFSWEILKKAEAGIELEFLNSRLVLSASYYRNRTGNQLVGYPLPNMTGFSTVQANLPAVIQNNGLEIMINTQNINHADVKWSSSFNITIPRSKLIDYPNFKASSYANTFVIGMPLNIRKLLHYTGIDPISGIYTFEDVNKDGIISYPDDYQTVVITGQRYYGGFDNTISYKNIEFTAFFQFVKQKAQSYIAQGSMPGSAVNQPVNLPRQWQKPGDIAEIQKFSQDFGSAVYTALSNYNSSDASYVDASFIRLKTVTVSYQLPSHISKKAGIQHIRIYGQAQNLLTLTKYKELDPETANYAALPVIKMITAGIQFTF
jgi:TonB-dependent starch-binding outer membrane protein SusC